MIVDAAEYCGTQLPVRADPDVPSTFDLLAYSHYLVDVWLSGLTISLLEAHCQISTAKRGSQKRQAIGTCAPHVVDICYCRLVVKMKKDIQPGCSDLQPIDVHALYVLSHSMLPQYSPTWTWPPCPPERHLNESPCLVEMS